VKRHLRDLVVHSTLGEVERNARLAVVGATMASARMILSKTYLLWAATNS
jgi:hypothetical protein